MIFQADTARLIVRGRKRVARLPVRWGEGRCWVRPGRSYAVQPGVGRSAIGRIFVTDVERDRLGNISFDDARAEGFRTTNEFKLSWVQHHDRLWVRQQEAMMAEASKINDRLGVSASDEVQEVLAEQSLFRFGERHADRDVWVIRFELDRSHRPRLLAPASRGERDGDEHGYTDNPRRALRDEPEAIDRQSLEQYIVDAHTREAGRPGRREEVLKSRARSLAVRLRQETIAADRNGVDVTNELDQIEQHLRVLENRRKAT